MRWGGTSARTAAVVAVTVLATIGALVGTTYLRTESPRPPSVAGSPTPSRAPQGFVPPEPLEPIPSTSNVVLIVADDLDWKLWDEIPRLRALKGRGTTFTNYVVADSLCCPSRSTIFRGQYVHNHQVVSNDSASGGGWATFRDKGYPQDCLPTWLQQAGVHTGMMGKYLNQFPDAPGEETSVQPGWDSFVVPVSRGQDYVGYDYQLDDNGTLTSYGHQPQDFLSDVLDAKARDFLLTAPDHFFLELASFNPHLPSPVAPRNLGSHVGAIAPRDAAYDTAVIDPPAWLAGLPRIRPKTAKHLDRTWQRRAESAESVADSVDSVLRALVESGHDKDTLVLVTSDNGFHVGSYRMHRGKRSAFDVDTVVPLVAIGPGIVAGRTVAEMTSETDLAPTIAAALDAGIPEWVDGRSLWPVLRPTAIASALTPPHRTGVLSESLGVTRPGDPDFQLIAPPQFGALRTEKWLYVEYVNGDRELYNRFLDPFEIHNVIASTPSTTVAALQEQLQALRTCAGPDCRIADVMPVPD